jgi:hypothetical protein
MLQGQSKIVQRCNTNGGAQASEDSSELAAQQSYQRCTGDLAPRGGGGGDLEACNLVAVIDVFRPVVLYVGFIFIVGLKWQVLVERTVFYQIV